MTQRLPLCAIGGDLRELPSGDTLPLPAFTAGGAASGVKLWFGETVTTTGGAWSIDLSSAGFTSTPKISVTALSSGTTLAASATAILTARSTTAASGYVNLPAVIVVGGLGDQRAGSGLTVMVTAIGP